MDAKIEVYYIAKYTAQILKSIKPTVMTLKSW